jgi:hypothetical protein
MKYFTIYTTLIFAVKFIFIILALTQIYLRISQMPNSVFVNTVDYWKSRIEFLFVFLMAGLLLYLFAPPMNKSVDIAGEPKLLLFLFGTILLTTAKWGDFFNESPTIIKLQDILGLNE